MNINFRTKTKTKPNPPCGLAAVYEKTWREVQQQYGSRCLQQAARQFYAPFQLQASQRRQKKQTLRFPQKPDSIHWPHAPKGKPNPNPNPIPISYSRFVSIYFSELLKQNLPPDVREAQEQKLEALKKQQEIHTRLAAERKIFLRDRKIKFFERRKIERRIRRLEKLHRASSSSSSSSAAQPYSDQLSTLKRDLQYVMVCVSLLSFFLCCIDECWPKNIYWNSISICSTFRRMRNMFLCLTVTMTWR